MKRGLVGLIAVLGVVVIGLMVAAPQAQAITFFLTSDHCTSGCGTPPFGAVTLTQNGTTVDITVELFGTNVFIKSGSADFQNFKFNGTGVALGDITVDAHVPPLVAAQGAFNGDGTGTDIVTFRLGGVTVLENETNSLSYTVNEDCTGSFTVLNGPSFGIFIAPDGESIATISTAPPGNEVSGISRRVSGK